MLPAHCKDVAFKRVDFPLNPEEMERRLKGQKAFTRTDYFILEYGKEHAVLKVRKKRGIDLFRTVETVEVLSVPDSTVFVEDPECDVLNHHEMAKKAASFPHDTVVVLGKFNHISFIKGGKNSKVLRVVDFVPPKPSKTLALVEAIMKTTLVRTPLLLEPLMVDAFSRLPDIKDITVMFPCEAGRLELKGRPVLYLDKTPPLPNKGKVILAGCQLSRRIFRNIYGYEPDFVNLCPRDLARELVPAGELAIARCCDVHRVKVENGLALLPYGATMDDVVSALKALVGEN
jgi:hypothetical protein